MSKKKPTPAPEPVLPPVKPPRLDTLRRYGLTEADWHRMCAECKNTCVVCGNPFGERPLAIDHEHVKGFKAHKKKKAKSGRTIRVRKMSQEDRRKHVRGIVHNFCNRFVRSWLTLPRARAIVSYLEAHERRTAAQEQ